MKFFILLKKAFYLLIKKKIRFSIKNLLNRELILAGNDNTVEFLKEPILNSFNYSYLPYKTFEKKDIYYITPKIIIFFLNGFFIKKLNLTNSYLYSIFKVSKPSAVFSQSFDHNLIFVAKELKHIKFFVLLQGTWFNITKKGLSFVYYSYNYNLSKCRTGNLKNFNIFVWGQKDQDIFEDIGVNKFEKNVNFLKVGSYESSYYSHKFSSRYIIENNSILFISQLQPHIFSINHKFQKLILRDSITAIKLVLNFAIKNNIEFRYLCRGKNNNNRIELDYLRLKISNFKNIKIVENKSEALWNEIFASKLVTSCYSTGAHDAILLKKKTILLPLNHKNIYKWSSDKFKDDISFWPWTILRDDQEKFDKLCKNLLNMNDTIYREQIKKIHSYWFDKRYNESHNVIKDIIKNEIRQ